MGKPMKPQLARNMEYSDSFRSSNGLMGRAQR